jgi:hypothetical protein
MGPGLSLLPEGANDRREPCLQLPLQDLPKVVGKELLRVLPTPVFTTLVILRNTGKVGLSKIKPRLIKPKTTLSPYRVL